MLNKLILFGFFQIKFFVHVFFFSQDLTQNNDSSFTIEFSKLYSTWKYNR